MPSFAEEVDCDSDADDHGRHEYGQRFDRVVGEG
jgi:hypothetical protein